MNKPRNLRAFEKGETVPDELIDAARMCVATLQGLKEGWTPLAELSDSATSEQSYVMLIACGYCEEKQQYRFSLLDGSERCVRICNHGMPGGSRQKIPMELQKLIEAEFLGRSDSSREIVCQRLEIRPTTLGEDFRCRHRIVDEAAVHEFLDVISNPPAYWAGRFAVVPANERDDLDFLGLDLNDEHRIVTRKGHAPFQVEMSRSDDQWRALQYLYVRRVQGASKSEIMSLLNISAESAKKLRQRLIDSLSRIHVTVQLEPWVLSEDSP